MADAKRRPGERKGSGIGEHVPSIGDQRQRAGEQATDHLGHHAAAGQQHRPEHLLLVVPGCVVVRVIVRGHHSCLGGIRALQEGI
jgi:hypothetical protein